MIIYHYSETGGLMEEAEKVSLWTLFWVFAKVGVMTFGGGMAMLPILTREISENRKWASEEELANYYAVGQCTPGVIAVNTATFIGHSKRGITGGIIATLGLVFPSLIIIIALAGVIARFSDNIYVQKAFMGIRACVVVLIVNAKIRLWKSSVKDIITLIIFIIACTVGIIFNISPVLIVIICAMIGVVCVLAKINIKGVEDA